MASRLPVSFHARTLEKAYPADHTYKVALYENLQDVDAYTSAGECSGAGYTPGGVTLTGRRIVERDGGADLVFNTQCDWFNADIRARGAVVYDATNGDVISILDFERSTGVIGGVFTVNLNKNGVAGIGNFVEAEVT